jgi:hypothetical protein
LKVFLLPGYSNTLVNPHFKEVTSMAIEVVKHSNTVLLCLSMVLCFPNIGAAQQSSEEASVKTADSGPLHTTARITDLKISVPIDEFHERVPALRELDRKIVGMNFMSVSGKSGTSAKEVHFENSKGESGIVRVFTKTYTQMQTSFDLEVYRIQIDSNKRYVLWTVAVQPMGGADNLAVMFQEIDSIDSTHDARNSGMNGGCFDTSVARCPPNPPGSDPSEPGGAWAKCFREIAHEVSECVAWEGFTESCAMSIAEAVGASCP